MKRKRISVPPPIIDSARVLYYAIKSDKVVFTNRLILYVGKRLLKEVPCMAICDNKQFTGDFLLLLCNSDWESQGAIGAKSVEEAKKRAEVGYSGISKEWQKSKYTKTETDSYLANCEKEREDYWDKIIAAVKRKLTLKVIKCCICKKPINNPEKNFGFHTPKKYENSRDVPISVYTNLRNVDCYHAANCRKAYEKLNNIKILK